MSNEINIQPSTTAAARDEIERTRARMSETIDEIEDVLLRKKGDIISRFDVVARLKERPLQVAGAAALAGLLLGLLTGGGRANGSASSSGTRPELWEARARRLLAIARTQEEEIENLEATVADLAEVEVYDGENDDFAEDDLDDSSSRFADIRSTVVDRVGDFATTAARSIRDVVHRAS